MADKQCSKCGEVKPAEEYYRSKRTSDGLAPYCKSCQLAYNARWRAANPDKVNAASKKWYAENPEKAKTINQRWRRKQAMTARLYNEFFRDRTDDDDIVDFLDNVTSLEYRMYLKINEYFGDDELAIAFVADRMQQSFKEHEGSEVLLNPSPRDTDDSASDVLRHYVVDNNLDLESNPDDRQRLKDMLCNAVDELYQQPEEAKQANG